jgi:glycosyltransferase involved in cell wall biosynthesis
MKPIGTNHDRSSQRIGIFNPALTGGGEKVLLHLSEGFLAQGFQVDLVLGEVSGPYVSHVNPRVRVVDLHSSGPAGKLLAMTRYLKRERPVLLITADDFVNVAALAKRLSGVSTVIAAGVHNTMSELFKTQRTWRGLVRRHLFPRVIRLADYVIPVSHCAAEDLIAMAGLKRDRVRVIYNAVLDAKLLELAQAPVDHPFFRPGAPPVLVAVGRLSAQKDFATLLRAFALVRAKSPARLLILGEGEDRAELEALAASLGLGGDVDLAGFVHNPYSCVARAAAVVSSSRFEGLPTVLIEALALNRPVVATNCAGSAEVLENGRWGRLVPIADPGALAHALLLTLADPVVPAGLQESLEERFAIPRITAAYLELFQLSGGLAEPGDSGGIRFTVGRQAS